MDARIKKIFAESCEVKQAFLDANLSGLIKAVELTIEALQKGGKLLVFGNGGSASDAQHIAAELVDRIIKDRRAIPAIALTTDTSILTSIANDSDFSDVFARQIEALGLPGDVVLAISTSGGSPNVVRAIETARAAGMKTIALTGGDGGEAARLADLALNVSTSTTTARIQEAHITAIHVLCEIIEERLFESRHPNAAEPQPNPNSLTQTLSRRERD